jgi:hypothetical protein
MSACSVCLFCFGSVSSSSLARHSPESLSRIDVVVPISLHPPADLCSVTCSRVRGLSSSEGPVMLSICFPPLCRSGCPGLSQAQDFWNVTLSPPANQDLEQPKPLTKPRQLSGVCRRPGGAFCFGRLHLTLEGYTLNSFMLARRLSPGKRVVSLAFLTADFMHRTCWPMLPTRDVCKALGWRLCPTKDQSLTKSSPRCIPPQIQGQPVPFQSSHMRHARDRCDSNSTGRRTTDPGSRQSVEFAGAADEAEAEGSHHPPRIAVAVRTVIWP